MNGLQHAQFAYRIKNIELDLCYKVLKIAPNHRTIDRIVELQKQLNNFKKLKLWEQ